MRCDLGAVITNTNPEAAPVSEAPEVTPLKAATVIIGEEATKLIEKRIDDYEKEGREWLDRSARAAENRLYIDAAPLAAKAAEAFAKAAGLVPLRAEMLRMVRTAKGGN